MARFPFQSTAVDQLGKVMSEETVTVTLTGTATVAIIYAASSGGSAIANGVITTGTDGSFKFWVDEADYSSTQRFRIAISGDKFVTKTNDDVPIVISDTLGSLTPTDGNFAVGNGTIWVVESGATARTSLGLGNVENTALSTWTGSVNIVTVGTLTSGNATAIVSAATTSLAGKSELATNAEVETGTDTGRVMTPSNVPSIKAILQNSQSAAYTTVLADAGKHIYHPGADTSARTWTIDSNANVAYPLGSAITFVNDTSGGVITIAITSDTLILAPDGTTGSRTLAANGVATAIKMTTTRWMISGSGLT